MDDVPLYEAYHISLEEQQKAKGQQAKKTPRAGTDGQVQDLVNYTWSSGSFALQDPSTVTWTNHNDTGPGLWPSEKIEAQKKQFQFFLAKFRTPSDKPSVVTRLDPEDCLREVLRNTRVLEFPTIWVLDQGQSLPETFTLGPKDKAPQESNKRKNPPGKKGPAKPNKRRNKGQDVEEGEVRGDEEGNESDDGINTGFKGVSLEEGDVIAEQSLGEEDDDDDETSSSGSDSD
ncbi:hypothetical protein FOC4_g10012866 [Fusarium odoratissimum]|uniref:BCD1 alpha/beta domain-containing protein n=3 Tax=Fusarium oxysporum species complex TaxID=171631 RepID=N1RRI2_FUSC4|nr:hypothetical protein FOC4_g10012866 [Fusarium odoratissimum]